MTWLWFPATDRNHVQINRSTRKLQNDVDLNTDTDPQLFPASAMNLLQVFFIGLQPTQQTFNQN